MEFKLSDTSVAYLRSHEIYTLKNLLLARSDTQSHDLWYVPPPSCLRYTGHLHKY